jgi:hypothetical protein
MAAVLTFIAMLMLCYAPAGARAFDSGYFLVRANHPAGRFQVKAVADGAFYAFFCRRQLLCAPDTFAAFAIAVFPLTDLVLVISLEVHKVILSIIIPVNNIFPFSFSFPAPAASA